MNRSSIILLILFAVLVAACVSDASQATIGPAPTAVMPPRATVPVVPTSTPSSRAPASQAVLPVALTTADGVAIKGDYYRPSAENAPAILLLHDPGGQRGDWQFVAWQLMEQGFATLAIDLRGYGESGGLANGKHTDADVAAAVDFLKAQAEVDSKRIVIIGAGGGSWWALAYAATHPDIRGLAMITPGIRNAAEIRQQLATLMTAYGNRPFFVAVSDHEGNHDPGAVKIAKLLNDLASGPHQMIILHDWGRGTDLLMQENGLFRQLLAWIRTAARK